jgi:hypothetical protein
MLCDVGGTVDRRALVAALKAVQGVADADVDPDAEGGLGTLRLDLEAGVDEVTVASQVSKVLREQFGLGVDADRVELVELSPDDEQDAAQQDADEQDSDQATADEPVAPVQDGPQVLDDLHPVQGVDETRTFDLPGPRTSHRPSITKIHLVSSGLDVMATVTLASGSRTAVGEARGLASQSGVHRAVAVATLHAVEQLVGGVVRVELEHLEVATTGSERTVLVRLNLLSAQGSELLTGAAAVRDDVRQAVIRATLDALNRRLELLLSEV